MLLVILSLIGVFRDVLFILFLFFLIRLIARWLQPSASKDRFQSKSNQKKPAEGEIILRFNKKGERIKDKKGEYVDYEEVD
jgi:hypothetical protein